MDAPRVVKFINLGVVVNKNNEVLMIRRKVEETGKDGTILRWAFPGGRLQLPETRSDCVKREVLAETGYLVKPLHQISVRKHPHFSIDIAYHLCDLQQEEPAAEPVETYEVAEVRWVKPEEIEALITTDLDPVVKQEIASLIRTRSFQRK
ncbi:MAG: hypothetical protein A3H06_02075 [Candidatus Colwellbacteria bacterium RIFCSPLOWO2_12_FULL_44_13]|uniref:Nudix hydrolase domain-containing protein n=3 Tax=Candidatus Colwelliibacteriota TaxID=1817904 RepID=A0A1G1ZAC7_9BACT|nr:MAG: hypothetical protein A3F24_01505 [Candidatus Colwellbacteria bacterium RIFCSPHIGHO2_12_FULL_44_17]OGY60820.1 MAG: hypothetical protein A3I31_02470 [Candidatus Colwellbacteria bacterium RIFCSPLOWO2_02_FULL_44_20b]OGY62010.1 MAG: hypothetical protein A3H06_02075 [Candidatus Colwellbacteria bacterium RIFCSPLOWO2_12_FULL_44_13]